MNEIFDYIKNVSDNLALTYNVDLSTFFLIYFISFLPFYLGYFLIIYGSTRNLSWRDVYKLNLKGNLNWTPQVETGLYIHLFGRAMPYIYVFIWGRNISWWIYAALIVMVCAPIYILVKKIYDRRKVVHAKNIEIARKDLVTDNGEISLLWKIYDETFTPINKISPCKQSLDQLHFEEAMKDTSVRKYILVKNQEIIGVALITNNFINTPWISPDYFSENFSQAYKSNLIFYFMGLAISKDHRGNKYSIMLMEYILDDIPSDGIVGFDHSRNINPLLHHFTKVIKQASTVKRVHIDRQHYHVVHRKK